MGKECGKATVCEKERKRQQKTFQRLMAATRQKKPVCTKKGVVWGTDRDMLK